MVEEVGEALEMELEEEVALSVSLEVKVDEQGFWEAMVMVDTVMEESEDMAMVGANTVEVEAVEVGAVVIMGAALIQLAVMASKIILDSGIEVMIVEEDKEVKNATKEAVDMVDLAMITEDKEIFMEDSKIQDMVGMIFVTKESAKETTAVKVVVMKERVKAMEVDQ